MTNKERYYSVFKYIIITILLVSAFSVTYDAASVHKIKYIKSDSGQKFYIIINKTNKSIYCVVTGGKRPKAFMVYAKKSTREQIKPIKNFRCICK